MENTGHVEHVELLQDEYLGALLDQRQVFCLLMAAGFVFVDAEVDLAKRLFGSNSVYGDLESDAKLSEQVDKDTEFDAFFGTPTANHDFLDQIVEAQHLHGPAQER